MSQKTVKALHRCPMCKQLFDGKENARFCGARCRKRAQRANVSGKGKENQTLYDLMRRQFNELAGMGAQNTIKVLVLIGLELLEEKDKRKIYEMLREYPWENQ